MLKNKKLVATTPFSEFFREASSREKKKTYRAVLKSATESQVKVIHQASKTA